MVREPLLQVTSPKAELIPNRFLTKAGVSVKRKIAFEKSFFEKKLLSGQRVYQLKNGVAEMNEVKLAACSTFLQTMS